MVKQMLMEVVDCGYRYSVNRTSIVDCEWR